MDSSPKKNAIEFTENNSFDELVVIESKISLILVNFYAQWYTLYIKIKSKLEEISNNNNIKLINIEVDEKNYPIDIMSDKIPHIFIFHNGYSVMDFSGNDKKKY